MEVQYFELADVGADENVGRGAFQLLLARKLMQRCSIDNYDLFEC